MDKIAELTAYTEYLVRFGFLGVAVFLILIVAPLVQGLLKSPVATKATLATGGLFLPSCATIAGSRRFMLST